MAVSTESSSISSDFPFESRYVDVLGSRMHYIEEGEGDPIVFLHGNPMSSYLWRNILPHLADQGRCIAPDLIGMGKSDKPDIAYRYDDQYRYLSAFLEQMDLGDNVTIVLHDWGSGLGFRWAHEHKERIKGLAFMEAMVRPLTWDFIPGPQRMAIRMMRFAPMGFLMSSVGNIFVKKMIPDMIHRELPAEVKAAYAEPYPTVASRKAITQWPRELPIDNKPADNAVHVNGFTDWLQTSDVPKLLFTASPGAAITEVEAEWCREHLPNLEVVDIGDGLHFIQEDNPHLIGETISGWYDRL